MYQGVKRTCSACGTALADREAFCNNCGRPYSAAYAPPSPPRANQQQPYDGQAAPRRSPWLIGSISALVLLALIGGGFFALVLPRLQQQSSTTLTQNAKPTTTLPHINPYSYTGHSSVVWQVAWSPDGQYIASASADHTVQVGQPR